MGVVAADVRNGMVGVRADACIAVSIINYRTGAMTLDCIRSVLTDAEASRLPIEIAVIDNRSDDGSAEEIEAWIVAQDPPVPVRLVRSATNAGYSGGHNQGLATTTAPYLLILNSDALLCPGCLAALHAAMEADPRLGLLAPRLEWPDGAGQISAFRLPTPVSEIIRGAASGPVTKRLARADIPLGLDPAPADIGWVSFACVLVRRAMVDEIGPMDDGFFLYFEDTEFCARAARAGWRIGYLPEARAVHLRGGSAPVKRLAKARKRLPAYYYASRTRCFRLLHGRAGPLTANLGWALGRLIARLRPLMGAAVPPATEAEWRDIWTNFWRPLGPSHAPRASREDR